MTSLPRAIPAFDVGGTHVTSALVDTATWQVVDGSSTRAPLETNGEAHVILDAIAGCGLAMAHAHQDRYDISSVWGAAMPGPFDYANGIGQFEGVAKFDSLNGYDVREGLLARLAPVGSAITFINDADAFAVGEWVSGSVQGRNRVAGITLGTGVGSAFLSYGRVVNSGGDVPPFGEVHLLEIDGAPLEDACSRRAMVRLYAESAGLGDEDVDVARIAELARSGDEGAARAIREPLTRLGRGLAPWMLSFGAHALVVGGSIARSWDLVGPPLIAGLTSFEPSLGSLEVVQAAHFDDSGLAGAAVDSTRK